jgi:hypothetical protein
MIRDDIKAQLQRLITHLELDISILIQDVGSIREIFNQIKDDLPSFLKEMIQPAALEGNCPKFFSTQSILAAGGAQKNSTAAEGQCIQEILSVKKTIDLLKESPVEINKELTTLNEERSQLLARAKIVDDTIKQKEAVSKIPASLADQKRIMASLKTKLDKIKTEKKAKIPGSAEEDHQQIAKVDSIRVSTLNSIKSALKHVIQIFQCIRFTLVIYQT